MNMTLNRRAKRVPQGCGVRDWRCRWYGSACTGPENTRTPGIPLAAASVKRGVKHPPCSLVSSGIAAITRRAHDREDKQMALFMDVHNVEGGVSAADVAGAHEADLATQGAYGVNYLRYWVDQEAGKIFCLVDAPDAEAANTVHRQAHGLVADEIYPVSEYT